MRLCSSAGACGRDRELDRPPPLSISPGGPELAVVGEADRVRALAVEGGLQRLAEARAPRGSGRRGRSTGARGASCRPAGSGSARSLPPVPSTLPALQRAFAADHGGGEERGAARVGEQDADLRRGAVGQRRRLGPLEQDVAVLGRRAGPLPEDVGGGGGDPLEVRAAPGCSRRRGR